MKKYSVVEFTEKDAGELAVLFKKVWSESFEYPEGWRKKRSYTAEQIINEMRGSYRYFGIRNKIIDKIDGVYKAVIRGNDCYGEQQTVDPEYAGLGLAAAMYEQFIEFAKNSGCHRNIVNILAGQPAGLKCMTTYGFKETGAPYEQYPGMMVQRYTRETE